MTIEIKFVDKVDENKFIALYKVAGWWEEEYDSDISFIQKLVINSHIFAAAFDADNSMVGMGRVISDGCSDAYIQDVVVLREFRGKGIGGKIISALVAELTKQGIDWIGLIGEPGTESFYEKLGFNTLKNHIPMKYKLFSVSEGTDTGKSFI
jgi:spermidine synthase